jgi:DNA-directed RNA polymerase specialized sigma24 family protein
VTDAELKKILSKARALACSRGHSEIADDFAQEAVMALLRGRQTCLTNLLTDFLRSEYGMTRERAPETQKVKVSERRRGLSLNATTDTMGEETAPLSERLADPEPEPAAEPEAWRWRELIHFDSLRTHFIHAAVLEEEELPSEAGKRLGISGARVGQILAHQVRPEITRAYGLGHLLPKYKASPRASQLVIDWITL